MGVELAEVSPKLILYYFNIRNIPPPLNLPQDEAVRVSSCPNSPFCQSKVAWFWRGALEERQFGEYNGQLLLSLSSQYRLRTYLTQRSFL
jgi:hypothetical protein